MRTTSLIRTVYSVPMVSRIESFTVYIILDYLASIITTLIHSFILTFSPINFLDPRHRLVYALACASQASLWLELLTITFSISIDVNKWVAFIPNYKGNYHVVEYFQSLNIVCMI